MSDSKAEARWEYRAFGLRELDRAAQALTLRASSLHRAARSDQYLITRMPAAFAVKIRDGAFDVKRLIACRKGFEQWLPVVSDTAEIDREWLTAGLTAVRRVETPNSMASVVHIDRIQEFLAHAPDVELVSVDKDRTRMTHARALSEIVRVEVDGQSVQSIAVESADLDAARSLLRAAGLATRPNRSYPEFLRLLRFPEGRRRNPP